MMLREDSIFCRKPFLPESGVVESLAFQILETVSARNLFYMGYHEPDEIVWRSFRIQVPSSHVDNFFTLWGDVGFETQPLLLTVGLRSSRFAPVLLWEAFHALSPGGLWLDIDFEDSCKGTNLCDSDFLDRIYYCSALEELSVRLHGKCRARLMKKTAPSMISPLEKCTGWTFGILTSGPSSTALQMIKDIVSSAPGNFEIIICGPAPGEIPVDERIRWIDLETPEPRGWITRKKNMIADAARYENLCILHDRFIFPGSFFESIERYGPVFSILTFPQVYHPDYKRECVQRYPDYQLLSLDTGIRDTFVTKVYDGNRIFHPRYDDFSETAFCCGGVYLTKTAIWKLIRQDESLFHCEWEDVLFGLESQRMGIPHRVNPYACFKSVAPHPLLLTSIHLIDPSGRLKRSFDHISCLQKRKAINDISDFLPILNVSKRTYCEKLTDCFNSMSMVNANQRIRVSDFRNTEKLSEIWELLSGHASRLSAKNRDEIFQIISLISHMVYNYPACVLQSWAWDEECRLSGMNEPTQGVIAAIRRAYDEGGLKLVASLTFKRIGRTLGSLIDGGETAPPRPFLDIIDYFREVERYYPVIFKDDLSSDNRNKSITTNSSTGNIHKLLAEDSHWKTIFLRRGEEVLPLITDDGRNSIS